jgi:Magnesium chelatase, subunit ChlI
LDEFPEFGSRVLEVMRQPMEDKIVTISHSKGSLTFSASFQLVAAMNPCPCSCIQAARIVQLKRFSKIESSNVICNADMQAEAL